MDLSGLKVKHLAHGVGTVTAMTSETTFDVKFAVWTKHFNYPEAFDCTMTLLTDDKEFLDQITNDVQRYRAEKAVSQPQIKRPGRNLCDEEYGDYSEKEYVPAKRVEGIPNTYFVFQAGGFDDEARESRIWAPIYSASGNRLFYWDSLLSVRKDDVIFHGSNGYIKGISRVMGACYDAENPNLWADGGKYRNGRRADCEYTILKNPIRTEIFRDEIVKYCNVKYAPFDKNGNGNQGYLYDLDSKLATVFLKGIIKENPEVEKLEYVQWLLK